MFKSFEPSPVFPRLDGQIFRIDVPIYLAGVIRLANVTQLESTINPPDTVARRQTKNWIKYSNEFQRRVAG